jgi:hypothetical protein
MRLALHWSVRLGNAASGAEIHAETLNISSGGFYCIARRPLTPGETVDCAIEIPAPSSPGRQHSVNCRCTVLRIERLSDESFGLACHIDDYSLSPGIIE